MIFQLKQHWFVPSIVFLIVALPTHARRLPAQNPSSALVTPDTGSVEEGRRAGRVAADAPRVDRFALAYGGGLAIGMLGPLVFTRGRLGSVGLGAGFVMIGAVWKFGDNRPPADSASERGDAYRRAYSESYEQRLRERRRNAALIGGVAGTVSGFAILFLTYAAMGTAY